MNIALIISSAAIAGILSPIAATVSFLLYVSAYTIKHVKAEIHDPFDIPCGNRP